MNSLEPILKQALNGDIVAFQQLFAQFQPHLKSYLYRLLVDRNDTDDLTHDTFVRAFDKLGTFAGGSSLKTWVFQIATNLAYDFLRTRPRWRTDAQDVSKAYSMANLYTRDAFFAVHAHSPQGDYDIREHIDFCFTCTGKTLPIEHQVALLLKDVYGFSVVEISQILDRTESFVKHLLRDARQTMIGIFADRCALVSKTGTCHQCSELNGVFNPKQNKQVELMKLALVRASEDASQSELYELRAALVQHIDPLTSGGADLQDAIMRCTRKAIGETNTF
ncbi:RNA polymerase sigma factor [Fibrella aquatilis]|uniref:RNA polymerase sigma factor n=1 Tax=Fibrella aquatilis TaxID=2817059 RepID=A0A939G3J3_9BACT|nr:RNA polymerase sigma factor [Fibrella aquatilis]MBO0930440.1 RNA polymerase sigma factor [Fibrella aquatilis]